MPSPTDPTKANILTQYASRLRVMTSLAPDTDLECARLLANGFWDCRMCGGYAKYNCQNFGEQGEYAVGPWIEPNDLTSGVKLTDEEMTPVILMTANSIQVNNITVSGTGQAIRATAGPVTYESSNPSGAAIKEILTRLSSEREQLCTLMKGEGETVFGDMGYIDALAIRQEDPGAYASYFPATLGQF